MTDNIPTQARVVCLDGVIKDCWQIAEDHGFHGVQRTFGDTCTLIHSEISEAYEAFRNMDNRIYFEVDGKPEGVAVELADAVIRVFDTAIGELGLTPEQFEGVLLAKMEYNKRRPHLHGRRI